jgi:hypothetical protein
MPYSQQDILTQNINTYPNNNSGQITPDSVKTFNSNWIQSVVFTDQTGSMVVVSASYASNAGNANTASFAISARSSSFASTASFLLGNVASAVTAQTASYVANAMLTASVAASTITFTKFDGSTFDLTVAQSGSVQSASYAATAQQATSASFATTASYALNSTTINTGSFATTSSLLAYTTTASFNTFTSSVSTNSGSVSTRLGNLEAYTASLNTATSSYATKTELNAYTGSTNAFTASMKTYTGSVNTQLSSLQAFTSSLNTWTGSATSQFAGTASYATTARNVVNGLNISASNITVAQNETINGNLYVYGTASFAYTKTTTGSAVYIGDSFIVLNADAPTQPFAGIKVYDTGSGPSTTASLEWNGNNDYWITVEESGASAGILTGISGSKGSEVFPSFNRLIKGTGNNTVTNSNITDNGTNVSINSATSITGSTNISGSLTMNGLSPINVSHVNANDIQGIELRTNTNTTVATFGAGGGTGVTVVGQVNALAFSGSGALVTGVISSSYASNAGAAGSATSASYAATAQQATSASYASTAQQATSASFATTASYVASTGIATSASYAATASFVNPLVQDLLVTGSVEVSPRSMDVASYPYTINEVSDGNATGGNLIIARNSTVAGSTGSINISGSNNIALFNAGAVNLFVLAGSGSGFRGSNSIVTAAPVLSGTNGTGYAREVPTFTNAVINAVPTIVDNRPSQTGTPLTLSSVSLNSTLTFTTSTGSVTLGNSNVAGTGNQIIVTGSNGTTKTLTALNVFGNNNTASIESPTSTGNFVGVLVGGNLNTVYVSGSNTAIQASALLGYDLLLTGSAASTANYGSVVVGRFNNSGSVAANTVFEVGTGTSDAARRTSLYISSSGLTTISNLSATGNLTGTASFATSASYAPSSFDASSIYAYQFLLMGS